MRICNRKEFLSQQPGTLYLRFDQDCFGFGRIELKGDTINTQSGDWFFSALVDHSVSSSGSLHVLRNEIEKGEQCKIPMSEIDTEFDTERDGCFDEDEKFLVLSTEEVASMIRTLTNCHQMKVLTCDFCFADFDNDEDLSTGMINECQHCGKVFCANCAVGPCTCPCTEEGSIK